MRSLRFPVLLIFQSFHNHADADGEVRHFSQSDFPDIGAFQIDVEIHAHFPNLPFFWGFGLEGLKGFLVVFDDLEGDEVTPGLQQ